MLRQCREEVRYNRIGFKSNTPQSLRASSPNLGEQLFVDSQMFRCSISSPPRIGGVRRSREEVRKKLIRECRMLMNDKAISQNLCH